MPARWSRVDPDVCLVRDHRSPRVCMREVKGQTQQIKCLNRSLNTPIMFQQCESQGMHTFRVHRFPFRSKEWKISRLGLIEFSLSHMEAFKFCVRLEERLHGQRPCVLLICSLCLCSICVCCQGYIPVE